MEFVPEQRRATVTVLTPLGWVQGTLHMPPAQTLLDFLQSGSPVVKLTRARLPGQPEMVPFVALRTDAIAIVAPTIDELVEPGGVLGRTTPREVEIHLEAGRVAGRIEVLVNLRVSDFLRQQAGLTTLRDAVFTPHGPHDQLQVRRMPVAIVNLGRATALVQTGGNRR
jgi:hypothetical protein